MLRRLGGVGRRRRGVGGLDVGLGGVGGGGLLGRHRDGRLLRYLGRLLVRRLRLVGGRRRRRGLRHRFWGFI